MAYYIDLSVLREIFAGAKLVEALYEPPALVCSGLRCGLPAYVKISTDSSDGSKHPEASSIEEVPLIQLDRRTFHLRHVWHCECTNAIEELNQPSISPENAMRSALSC